MAIYYIDPAGGRVKSAPFSLFPNNEIKCPTLETYKFILKWESDADLIHLMLLKKHNLSKAHLTILYMPYSRMDRDASGGSKCSLRYIGEFIQSLGFASIEVIEPHSDLTLAYLGENSEASYPFFDNLDAFKASDVLMFPDAGAQKRYSSKWKGDSIVGNKVRDFNTGYITGYTVDNPSLVTGRDVKIVDDLCSKGTTFLFAARELRKYVPNRIDLVVTHCEDTVYQGELLDPKTSPIDSIITTNSILTNTSSKKIIIHDLI